MSFIQIGHTEIKLKSLELTIYGEENLLFFRSFFNWASNYKEHLFKSFDEFFLEDKELSDHGLTIINWGRLKEENIFLVKIDESYNQEIMFWRLTEFYKLIESMEGFDFKDFFFISEIQFSVTSHLFLNKNEIENEFLLCENLNDEVIVAKENDDSIVLVIRTEFGHIIFRAVNSSDINIEITYKNFYALNNLRNLIIENKQKNMKTELKNIIINNLQNLQISDFKLLENLERAFNRQINFLEN